MRRARDFVAATLLDRGFEGDTDVLLLLVSELATNAVRHAGTPFQVTVDAQAPGIRVAVIDGDVHHSPQVGRPGRQDTSGRGLLIVEDLAEGWGIEGVGNGSKSVWFTLT